jgi:hypothetical protein
LGAGLSLRLYLPLARRNLRNSQPDTANIYKNDHFVKMKRQARNPGLPLFNRLSE